MLQYSKCHKTLMWNKSGTLYCKNKVKDLILWCMCYWMKCISSVRIIYSLHTPHTVIIAAAYWKHILDYVHVLAWEPVSMVGLTASITYCKSARWLFLAILAKGGAALLAEDNTWKKNLIISVFCGALHKRLQCVFFVGELPQLHIIQLNKCE